MFAIAFSTLLRAPFYSLKTLIVARKGDAAITFEVPELRSIATCTALAESAGLASIKTFMARSAVVVESRLAQTAAVLQLEVSRRAGSAFLSISASLTQLLAFTSFSFIALIVSFLWDTSGSFQLSFVVLVTITAAVS